MSNLTVVAVRCAVVAALLAMGVFSPAVASAGWHLFHGMSIEYHGLRIHVPWLWTADTQELADDPPLNPQGLLLSKAAPSLFALHKSVATIYVNVILPDEKSSAQADVAEWESSFRVAHAHPGSIVEDAPIPGVKDAACFHARSKLFHMRLEWTCISTVGGWAASFDGPAAEAPAFAKFVSRLKP